MTIKHTLRLLGGEENEVRVSLSALLEVMSAYLDSVTSATRLAVEGRSTARGRAPSWLGGARDAIEITGLRPGSTAVVMESSALSEIDSEKFGIRHQPELFSEETDSIDEAVKNASPLELWTKQMHAIDECNDIEMDVDRSFLDGALKFHDAVLARFEGAELSNGSSGVKPLCITKESQNRLRRLRDKTPEPRAIRLTGILDTISHSKSNAALVLRSGTRISVKLEEHEPDRLKSLFGEEVVVSGISHFNIRGNIIRIDVESIERARPQDEIFAELPVISSTLPSIIREGQEKGATVADFFGRWPGNETEEELLEALRNIR